MRPQRMVRGLGSKLHEYGSPHTAFASLESVVGDPQANPEPRWIELDRDGVRPPD
jgi:hypothetical protein